MSGTKNCKIAISQLNFTAGDIEYNSKKILKEINNAKNKNADIILFQKNTILGFDIADLTNRFPSLIEENKKWLNKIAEYTSNITAVIGFTDIKDNSPCDCLAIIQDGKVKKILNIYKDREPVKINDLYFSFGNDFKNKEINNADILADLTPVIATNDIMCKLFNTYFDLSAKSKKTIIFVNSVGSTDNISFCGESTVFRNGKIAARAKSFEEDLLIYDYHQNKGIVNQSSMNTNIQNQFSLNYEQDLERIYKTIIQGIRDYFRKNNLKKACLGLSGGLDSTVCAVLLSDALGPENVFGVSMPSQITSKESKSDAKILAANLGIGFCEVPIKDIVTATQKVFSQMFESAESYWHNRYEKSFTNDNIQARARATYLWGISNEFRNCTPIATSDKSEAYMGYATVNGDMSGGFAPIADVTKTKLFALAKWLNKNRPQKDVIPESVILKRPGAELAIDENTGKPLKAEDALMPYEFLDEIIWRLENKNESYEEMVNSEFLYEKTNNITVERKKEWLDKFYKRMQTATYKWSIMPPAVVLDEKTINSTFFKYPISSNINFKSSDEREISEKLKEIK